MTALSCVEEDVLRCCGSKRFAKEIVSASPFTNLDHALRSACDIWFDKELVEWNFRYREKFGFVFLICASGRGTTEILAELKKRYLNRPIVELEIAAQEEMKIIELRLARLFNSDAGSNIPVTTRLPVSSPTKYSVNFAFNLCFILTSHVLNLKRSKPDSRTLVFPLLHSSFSFKTYRGS
ncbi:unnamed protein product [Musa acuminata subsp. malaccensis]|uniref:2-oxo-4-hydroxy-4-carboxy-5-ureidoimidazoline decarboxylase n=1 Tax=Musa acuminata subsp. malaccensis TaxID=214687 RepID=A0A8D6ZZW5_MUSAM|nr:unnamed protein product [Musa acuminata subsp. malaccensis]